MYYNILPISLRDDIFINTSHEVLLFADTVGHRVWVWWWRILYKKGRCILADITLLTASEMTTTMTTSSDDDCRVCKMAWRRLGNKPLCNLMCICMCCICTSVVYARVGHFISGLPVNILSGLWLLNNEIVIDNLDVYIDQFKPSYM